MGASKVQTWWVHTEVEDRARLLADLATALTATSTELDKVLDTAARAASALVGDAGVVQVVNEAGLMEATTVHHPDPQLTRWMAEMYRVAPTRLDEGTSGTLSRTRTPLVDNAVDQARLLANAPPATRPFVPRLDVRAMLLVPLVADDRYLGFLGMARFGREQPYTEGDVGLACDIAARVALAIAVAQLVAQLRGERDHHRQIMDTSLEGVWKIDRDATTTYVNRRMAEMLGVTTADLVGKPFTAWLTEPRDEVDRRMGRRWAGQSEQYETQLARGDGGTIWVQVAAAPIRDPHGTVVGALAMISDISDRVRNRELAARMEQLQRLDSLGQLAGGIAHDFNNLLGIIGGFTELLRGDLAAGSPHRALADQISSAVDKGAALTRQLLAFGRGQSGRAGVHDLPAVIADLAPMLRRALGEGIALHLAPAPADQPCTVRIDRGQLEQVIVNLAVNARDAMGTGGQLRIGCDRELLDRAELETVAQPGEPPAWYVRMAVSDTGSGMAPEALAHAFEPFYSTKPVGHGTGLGLASVYGIVRNAGGMVRLHSQRGQGTTVTVYLPAHQAESQPPAPPGAPEPSAAAGQRPGLRVLVVEDSTELADVIRRLLEPAGYGVTTAGSPREALDRLDAGLAVDLVVTDVVMPEMTGPELAAAIRTRQPDLPIIYTSGYTAGALDQRLRLEPDTILVAKPFTRASLLAAIDRLLS
jgi:two-component system cell cycle sensor histidine kinase/response regulator CckA